MNSPIELPGADCVDVILHLRILVQLEEIVHGLIYQWYLFGDWCRLFVSTLEIQVQEPVLFTCSSESGQLIGVSLLDPYIRDGCKVSGLG